MLSKERISDYLNNVKIIVVMRDEFCGTRDNDLVVRGKFWWYGAR